MAQKSNGISNTRVFNFPLKVVDHYENPRNVGSLDKNSKNVGTGLVGAPACGDVMKLQVSWRSAARITHNGQTCSHPCCFQIQVDENGKITDAKFKTFGCGSAIASSSLATEWVKGKSVWQHSEWTNWLSVLENLINLLSSCRLIKLWRSRTRTLPKSSAFLPSSFIAPVS